MWKARRKYTQSARFFCEVIRVAAERVRVPADVALDGPGSWLGRISRQSFDGFGSPGPAVETGAATATLSATTARIISLDQMVDVRSHAEVREERRAT